MVVVVDAAGTVGVGAGAAVAGAPVVVVVVPGEDSSWVAGPTAWEPGLASPGVAFGTLGLVVARVGL